MKLLQKLFNRKPHDTKSSPDTVKGWCDEFEKRRACGDEDGMKKALWEAYNRCGNKNSMCLNDVFCPECPMGGLKVTSGRAGM